MQGVIQAILGFMNDGRQVKEELVAELGASFLVNHAGLETPESFNNSAAYLNGWLSALKKDKRLIVSAAGAAEKAARMFLGKETEPDDAE